MTTEAVRVLVTRTLYACCSIPGTKGGLLLFLFWSMFEVCTTAVLASHSDRFIYIDVLWSILPCIISRSLLFPTLLAGDFSLPVLAGADVVEYFSMPEGSKPVIETGHIRSTYQGYLFFFGSLENQQAFEVSTYAYLYPILGCVHRRCRSTFRVDRKTLETTQHPMWKLIFVQYG